MKNKYLKNYIFIFLFAVSPILAAMLGGLISQITGEKISATEQSNTELGQIAYMLFMMHWLAIATIPFGLIMAIINTIFFLFSIRKKKKEN